MQNKITFTHTLNLRLVNNFCLIFLAILSLFISSCSQNDLPDLTIADGSTESLNVKSIKRYIEQRHPVKSRSNTRLIPIIQHGDTVAFLANYSEGWELFSNNTSLPMVLMKSKTGSFYPNAYKAESPFEVFYNNLIANLSSKPVDNFPDQTWAFYNEGRPGYGGEEGGDGDDNSKWGYVGDALERTIDISVPKGGRLKTKWGQLGFYNQFTPYYKDLTTEHSAVGCVAVALGQLLYHSNKYTGIPKYTVTSAKYNSTSNTYSFSGSDSDVWSLMDSGEDKNFSEDKERMKPTAVFLSYIAHSVKAEFAETSDKGTGAYADNALNFLRDQTNRKFRDVLFTWNGVRTALEAEEPLYGYSIDYTGYPNPDFIYLHSYVIDYAEEQNEIWYEVYAYRKNNDGDIDDSDNDFNGEMAPPIEYYQNKCGEISVKHTSTITNRWVKFNWGFNGYYDDVFLNTNEKIWNAGPYKFSEHHIFIH